MYQLNLVLSYIYASEEILNYKPLSVDLIFKVILPFKDLNLKGDLNVYNNYNAVNIMPKEKTHSFVINSKELTFKYNLMIDSNFSFPIKKEIIIITMMLIYVL